MLLAAQCPTGIAVEGPIDASLVKAIRSSHPPYNNIVNRLDYAAFCDVEPEASSVSVSGYGTVSGSNTSITMEFVRELSVAAVMIQTLKAATTGSWGINYMDGAKVQALVGEVWRQCSPTRPIYPVPACSHRTAKRTARSGLTKFRSGECVALSA